MSKWKDANDNDNNGVAAKLKSTIFTSVAASLSLLAVHAVAQQEEQTNEEGVYEEEVVVVSAARRALQDALTLKREAQNISDVLASGDIGEIPSLSVAEALEAIPGATTHRLKGSGSQVSLRGLGPVLGYETFNGRALTTGSEGRNVNFQQFPSELMDKIIIHKSQTADMVEGGTSGTVELRTVKPLDYGKRAMVLNLRGKYNSHASRIDGNDGLGSRGSFSYIDQFDVGEGALGVSAGLAFYDSGNPEESYLTSSSQYICRTPDSTSQNTSRCPNDGYDTVRETYSNLYTDQQSYITENGSLDGYDPGLYLTPSSVTYRTQDESERRWAFMGALQWQPNEQWEINADLQYSNKYYEEERLDIIVDDFRRGHYDGTAPDLAVELGLVEAGTPSIDINDDGTLKHIFGSSRVRLDGNNYSRDEDYTGGGIAVTFSPTDRLKFDLDLSYSETVRTREQKYARFRSNEEINFFYEDNGLVPEVRFLDWTNNGEDYSTGELFDPTDSQSFDRDSDTDLRIRLLDRESEISAVRFDADFEIADSGITSLETGVRYSDFHRFTDQDDSYQEEMDFIYNLTHDGADLSSSEVRDLVFSQCQRDFRNNDFFGSANGSNLGTEFVDFDTSCVINLVTNGSDTPPSNIVLEDGTVLGIAPFQYSDIDVSEIVTAAYVKANFDFDIGVPVTGNFGVRYVSNKIESVGRAGILEAINNGDEANPEYEVIAGTEPGTFTEFTVTNTENEFLPSATAIFELNDQFQIRTALYRSLSRHSIDFFSAGLLFDGDTDEANSPEAAVEAGGAVGVGNPLLKPIIADNIDVSFEWYYNEETTVSVALYSKDFESELQNAVELQSFDVLLPDGSTQAIVTEVTKQEETGNSANLWGIELNAQTVFTWLPSPFDGIGTRFTYNYSQTDFVTQDPWYGDLVYTSNGPIEGDPDYVYTAQDGVISRVEGVAGEEYFIGGLDTGGVFQLDEASFFGQSDHVASWTLFWDIGDFNFSVINKYRSEYFQPNFGDPRSHRWISSFHLIDLAARWTVNDMVKVRATVQNIGDEPQVGHRTLKDNALTLWSSTGPKWELGVTVKF